MRNLDSGVVGVVVSVFLFGSVGSVSAIEPFDLNSISLQYQREIRSTYIIQFQDNIAPSEVQGRANAIAARFQGRIMHTYTRALSGFAIRMNSTAMARLMGESDLGIARVSRAVIMAVAQSSDNAAPQAIGNNNGVPHGGGGGNKSKSSCDQKLGWNIARVTSMTQLDDANCTIEVNGYGLADYSLSAVPSVTAPLVCVLDTGVSEHPDINLGFQVEVSSNSTTAEDVYGHGTHVAGIIGAIANTEGVVGVAPGVVINSIKVLDDNGYGSDFDVIAGIDLALAEGCDIVNMSLGGPVSLPLDAAVRNASAGTSDDGTTANNIIFTLAAGNSAADIKDYSPARASTGPNDNIFTIASFGQERKTNADLWSSFSNYGAWTEDAGGNYTGDYLVDFVLPGGKVSSTVPGGEYATYNGTSMSAPHMAGLLVRYIVSGKGTTDGSGRVSINNDVFRTDGFVHHLSKVGRLIIADGANYDIPVD